MRTAVVTGGGGGIGADIARAFYAEGCQVVIASRSDSGLANELGERARFVGCDVRRVADLHATAAAAVAWTGRLDIFVNNAGFSRWRPLDTIDEALWDDMVDTNLKGALFGCQAAARRMGNGGVILNVSSIASKRGTANNSVYCATKFGMNGVTQALAKELGGRGIRVNGVCPVLVSTPGLLEALAEPDAPGAAGVEAFLEGFAMSQTALRRLPTGSEVAAACVFLASDAASAITGQSMNVDCGVLPQ
jgi:3-oxoacyl-[acyl-carrier protein] reductase/meso-butanediol dehydrogenase/(S,S)-butanediol dehydrogenase/diacetyl reductase